MRKDVCSNCKSTETYIYRKPDGTPIQADWRKDLNGNVLCKLCRLRLIERPRLDRLQKQGNARRVKFRGKERHVSFNPRTGICQLCRRSVHKGEIKQTGMHHTKYDENNILANTIEVCKSCHAKETWRLGQYWTEKFKLRNTVPKIYRA